MVRKERRLQTWSPHARQKGSSVIENLDGVACVQIDVDHAFISLLEGEMQYLWGGWM